MSGELDQLEFEMDFLTACLMLTGMSYDDASKQAREEIKEEYRSRAENLNRTTTGE